MNMETSTFDIRNFLENLQPAKQKNKYYCPVCNGNDLEIVPETGKYTCFHNCDRRDIREALKPWAEVLEERRRIRQQNTGDARVLVAPKKTKPQPKPVPLPEGELALARLGEVPTDIPQPSKPQFLGKKTREKLAGYGCTLGEIAQATVIVYDYGGERKSHRYQCPCAANKEKGYAKTFSVSRIDQAGKTEWNKGNYTWNAYRQEEAVTALLAIEADKNAVLLSQEGEKCVEIGRAQRIASISAQGTPNEEDWVCILNDIKFEIGDRSFIHAHLCDNDGPGEQKTQTIAKAAARCQIPFVVINLEKIEPNLCKKGDIEQVLASGMTGNELAQAILEEIERLRNEEAVRDEDDDYAADFSESADFDTLNPDVAFNQKALNFLYSDKPWISADDKLYRWDGNYYKYSLDSVERPKIASFCNSYVVPVSDGKGGFNSTFPYAKPAKVEEVLKWVKMRFEKDPNLLNPPGVNCTNGVVQVKWENGKPVRHLEEHDSNAHYYTYEPLIKYDPEADSTDCDRLLQCLDEPQQQVLLRNLGASLDLSTVRKLRGREVRQLLACGLGSNGKDALRQVVSTIYGHQGMTSCSLADFAAYDDGRKFALAPLMYSRVNWASENPQTARLDKIQSWKLFATGNKLHAERKGKDHIEFDPKAIGLYNLNEVPSFQGVIQAIQDRVAPLDFRKTFKRNPDPNNPDELQADPRFAYDEDFVRTNVAPAFLNKMLDALEALIEEGIDYSCTTDAFKSMQKENNHLFQFCEDIGLNYAVDSSMTAMEIWTRLEQWYIDNGTLTIEGEKSEKRTWNEQVKPSDKNVKAPNQVIARFLALFPKAKKSTKYCEVAKKSLPTITGIGIVTNDSTKGNSGKYSTGIIENTRPINENTRPKPDPIPDPITLINQDSRPTRPNFPETESDEEEKLKQVELLSIELNKEEEITEIGSGGSEPSDINTSSGGNWVETGSGNVNNGSGILINGSVQLDLDFDPSVNAELVRELLAGEDAGQLLSDLLLSWIEEQKSAVKVHLRQSEIEAVRRVVSEFSAICTETPVATCTDAQPQFKVGSRVLWAGDVYDCAWGAVGEVVDLVFDDFKVRWTRCDGTSFERRQSLGEISRE